MENKSLSLKEVIVKNINCVVEGIISKKEAVDEIIEACSKIKTFDKLKNLTLEDARNLYETGRIFLYCEDGQVIYADTEGLN